MQVQVHYLSGTAEKDHHSVDIPCCLCRITGMATIGLQHRTAGTTQMHVHLEWDRRGSLYALTSMGSGVSLMKLPAVLRNSAGNANIAWSASTECSAHVIVAAQMTRLHIILCACSL